MFLSRQEVRNVDRVAIDQFGFTGLQLMENAAGNAARRLLDLVPTGRFVILCGRGNNGGDGYVIARHLALAGCHVQIVSVAEIDDLSPDAKTNATIAERMDIPTRRYAADRQDSLADVALDSKSVVVDCLLGTGATGPPREPFRSLVRWANAESPHHQRPPHHQRAPHHQQASQTSCYRVAIDIPTGMDCDSGLPSETCFMADRTLTFVALKRGFGSPASVRHTGLVDVVSIGVGEKVLSAAGVRS